MKKSNIFRFNQHYRLTFRAGWQRLSRVRKTTAVLSLIIWSSFCLIAGLSSDRSYLLILLVSGISMFVTYVTQRPTAAKDAELNDSMLANLSVQNDRLYIAGEVLPANVNKLVLGKDPDRGVAFIQLAWNNGDEWQFAIDEYQAVAEYLSRYVPQLNVVYE
ncbi:MAG: hypothetical protein KKE30_05400 [Gammaproteobacteria bacterium]|nr:hypothetical protein [Gammaproteobacteria bacterium]MBU1553940.1 hypothetical protein [Gammaproteobacteria bacterium]MBU2071609.1 hypothetical protein [Gammaproteobacteria bacterium]MBU2182891.1 hypothetical protein [Gammaproteobacteria bacterium]MBU2203463.1 hypothetical protein [Gammaproteobacteria bacterium]